MVLILHAIVPKLINCGPILVRHQNYLMQKMMLLQIRLSSMMVILMMKLTLH